MLQKFKPKTILCVGDSLGLPRENVTYSDTWYSMIQRTYPQHFLVPIFKRELTTNEIAGPNKKEYLEYYNPDIIVMQIGIVDCAPRYLPKNSIFSKFINMLPVFFQKKVWRIWKSIFSRKNKYVHVNLSDFKNNLSDYFNRCEHLGISKLIFIKIGIPSEPMINKNTKIVNQIKLYNSIIDELGSKYGFFCSINPLESGDKKHYTNDGYHLNKTGSLAVAKQIYINLN